MMLMLLMIIASFAEVASIGAVLPFLGVLTAPEKIFAQDVAQPFIRMMHLQSAQDLILPFTIVFVITSILAGLTRISLLWFQTRLSMSIGADLSVKVYERTLYQPYSLHVSRNSSEILSGTRKAEGLVYYLIQPILIFISSGMILVAVLSTLLIIQPVATLPAFLCFGLIYISIISIFKRRIAKNSQIISTQQSRVTKAIQEGLGGIRDVLIDGTQSFYTRLYREAFIPMQKAQAGNQVVAGSPRFGVEALGMVFIAVVAYVLAIENRTTDGVNNAIPVLGAMAIGAQRLLPTLQHIYNAYLTIKSNQVGNQDALNLLDQPTAELDFAQPEVPMCFHTKITLENISFRYTPVGPWVLKRANLQITKGSRIGFVGVTGSGKSTFLDIFMGLLTPSEGVFLIDDTPVFPQNTRAWQAHISHVPQVIYLADTSIAENIAFGVSVELIDLERVKQAAQQAQIAQTIESWPNGYDTNVGERGVRLSGGQRQRIGIARALYKRADIIILDEATSALDTETEAAVMLAIETLHPDLTILIVAHRLTTLKNCDRIVEIAQGGIGRVGSYEQMLHVSS